MSANRDFIIVKGILVKYNSRFPFVEVPYGVTKIGKEAFSHMEIETISIPDTVTSIDDKAFYHCDRLYEIDLPNSIKTIGKETFSGCWNIDEMELPVGLECINDSAFSYTGLKELQIPDGVTAIGGRAFEQCSNLNHIVFPDSLKTIGWRAFYNCRKLVNVTFTGSLCTIEAEAFEGCNGLINQNGFIIINDTVTNYDGNDRVIIIPEGIRRISASAFYNKKRIKKVCLPDSLVSIGDDAFANCINLKEINISSAVSDIAQTAFTNCNKLADESGLIIFNGLLFGYHSKEESEIKDEKEKESIYQDAIMQLSSFDGSSREQLEQAIDKFECIAGYKDSEKILREYYKEYWGIEV